MVLCLDIHKKCSVHYFDRNELLFNPVWLHIVTVQQMVRKRTTTSFSLNCWQFGGFPVLISCNKIETYFMLNHDLTHDL